MAKFSVALFCGLAMTTVAPMALAQAPGLADTNKDGKVSLAEYQTSRRAFIMKADADHNGAVTRAEWDKYARSVRLNLELDGVEGADKIGQGGWFEAIDGDKNAVINPVEIDAMTLHRFAALDLNHDGFIDRPEAQQAVKVARSKL